MLNEFVPVKTFLQQAKYNTGLILIREVTTKKGSICFSADLLHRLPTMVNYLKQGKVRNYMFPNSVVELAQRLNTDLEILIKEIKPNGEDEQLKDEKHRYNLRLKELGLYVKRERDSDTKKYTIVRITHPELPNHVYFARKKATVSEATALIRFKERFNRLLYSIPQRKIQETSIAHLLRTKDEAFVEKFKYDFLPHEVTGVKEAYALIDKCTCELTSSGYISLNVIDKRHKRK